MTETTEQEQVVMTPKCKTANSTTLIIERKKIQKTNNEKVHVAGGEHTGIVINKEAFTGTTHLKNNTRFISTLFYFREWSQWG